MNLYLVRNRRDKTAVGLFYCHDKERLWWMVDWETDPDLCEYASVKESVIFLGPAQIGVDHDDQSTDDGGVSDEWKRLLLSEFRPEADLQEAILCGDHHKWKRLPYADEPGGGLHKLAQRQRDKRE